MMRWGRWRGVLPPIHGEVVADGECRKSWFTTRKILTGIGLVISTVMVYTGKMSADTWVYALAVLIAGHHAADIVKAFKGDR